MSSTVQTRELQSWSRLGGAPSEALESGGSTQLDPPLWQGPSVCTDGPGPEALWRVGHSALDAPFGDIPASRAHDGQLSPSREPSSRGP